MPMLQSMCREVLHCPREQNIRPNVHQQTQTHSGLAKVDALQGKYLIIVDITAGTQPVKGSLSFRCFTGWNRQLASPQIRGGHCLLDILPPSDFSMDGSTLATLGWTTVAPLMSSLSSLRNISNGVTVVCWCVPPVSPGQIELQLVSSQDTSPSFNTPANGYSCKTLRIRVPVHLQE